MIYDDQPQMVEAARLATAPGTYAKRHVEVAFAAIDREALIEKVERALIEDCWLSAAPGSMNPAEVRQAWRESAETVLVAAGIIP